MQKKVIAMRYSGVLLCFLFSFLMATNHSPNNPPDDLISRKRRLAIISTLRNRDLIVAANPPGLPVLVRERREGNMFFRILYLRNAEEDVQAGSAE